MLEIQDLEIIDEAAGPDKEKPNTEGPRVLGEDRDGEHRREEQPRGDGGQKASREEVAQKGFAGPGGEVPYRAEMEEAFGGTDFSRVRAHLGGDNARGANEQLGTEAYTDGEQNVAFRDENPSKETVGHELAHVQQQGARGVMGKSAGKSEGALEAEADAAGAAAAAGKQVGPLSGAGPAIRGKGGTPNTPTYESNPTLKFKLGGREFAVSFKDGVGVEVDFGGLTFPKAKTPGKEDGWKKSKDFYVNLVPGAGVRFEAAAGGSVTLGGKVKFTATKQPPGDNGKSAWTVSLASTAYAKAEFFGELSIGGFVGCEGANVSASFYAKPTATAEASIGAEGGLTYIPDHGFSGGISFPFDIQGELACDVGVKANWEFLFWDGEIGRFSFGKWVIGTTGLGIAPGVTFPGPVDTTTARAPWMKWGSPPKPTKVGGGRRSSSASSVLRNKGCCFVAGTLVQTEAGPRPIEAIAVGDAVRSLDRETGRPVTGVVTAVEVHEGDFAMRHFSLGDERIVTTPDHRFWRGEGWTLAGDLRPGDGLGQGALGAPPAAVDLPGSVVFNLRVTTGNYQVGAAAAVVRDH